MPHTGQRPTYFIPANFDHPPPPKGPIKLGQLVAAPEDPGSPVDPTGPEPINEVKHPGMEKFTNSTEFSLERRESSNAELGLFGKAFQSFVGAKLGFRISRATVSYVLDDIETLDVEFIQPTDDYVTASMEREKVKDFLKKHHRGKRLFMITGIKSAQPVATLERKDVTKKDASLEGEASGPAGSGTAGGGGHGKLSDELSKTLSLIPRNPFVYGYRLQECYYSLVRHNLIHKEFVTSASFGLDSKKNNPKSNDDVTKDVEEDVSIKFEGIEKEDLAAWDSKSCEYEFERISLSDEYDGSSCDVLIPVAK
jgi:hypothetical protein